MQNYKQILKEALPQLRKDFTLLQKILTVLRHLHLLGKCQGYELPTCISLGSFHMMHISMLVPIVPISGTRRLFRLKENIGAADIVLSQEEIQEIDHTLDNMKMSEVFGGSPVAKK